MAPEIRAVGVLGCGLMGSGIAQVAAASGYRTLVREVDAEPLAKGRTAIEGSLGRLVSKNKVTAADRDARFYDAPSGVICVIKNADDASTNPGQVTGIYVKTSNAGTAVWSAVWEPSAGLTLTPIQLADQYSTRGTPNFDPSVIAEPGGLFATMSGSVVRTDGGNIVNGSVIAYLPNNFLPYKTTSDYAVATTYFTTSQGNFKVTLNGDSTVVYYGPNVTWVSLDSIRYLRAQS